MLKRVLGQLLTRVTSYIGQVDRKGRNLNRPWRRLPKTSGLVLDPKQSDEHRRKKLESQNRRGLNGRVIANSGGTRLRESGRPTRGLLPRPRVLLQSLVRAS